MFILRFIGKVIDQIGQLIAMVFGLGWALSIVAAVIIIPVSIVILAVRHMTTWGLLIPVGVFAMYACYQEGKAAGKREASGEK